MIKRLILTAFLTCSLNSALVVEANEQIGYDDAIHTIETAELLPIGRVGEGGVATDSTIALAFLIEHPDGKKAFESLIAQASVPGQLFALCGLYFVDPDRSTELIAGFSQREGSVQTQHGCILMEEQIGTIVRSAHERPLKLRYHAQPFAEWLDENQRSFKRYEQLDIEGGVLPALILHTARIASKVRGNT